MSVTGRLKPVSKFQIRFVLKVAFIIACLAGGVAHSDVSLKAFLDDNTSQHHRIQVDRSNQPAAASRENVRLLVRFKDTEQSSPGKKRVDTIAHKAKRLQGLAGIHVLESVDGLLSAAARSHRPGPSSSYDAGARTTRDRGRSIRRQEATRMGVSMRFRGRLRPM